MTFAKGKQKKNNRKKTNYKFLHMHAITFPLTIMLLTFKY